MMPIAYYANHAKGEYEVCAPDGTWHIVDRGFYEALWRSGL